MIPKQTENKKKMKIKKEKETADKNSYVGGWEKNKTFFYTLQKDKPCDDTVFADAGRLRLP